MNKKEHPVIQEFGGALGNWHCSLRARLEEMPSGELQALVDAAKTYTATNCWFADHRAAMEVEGEGNRVLRIRQEATDD